MKELIKESWSHILYEKDGELILSVICGGVALFDVNIVLNEEERSTFEKHGQDYINTLAGDIRSHPSKFAERNIRID
jgi:hypothetical protein